MLPYPEPKYQTKIRKSFAIPFKSSSWLHNQYVISPLAMIVEDEGTVKVICSPPSRPCKKSCVLLPRLPCGWNEPCRQPGERDIHWGLELGLSDCALLIFCKTQLREQSTLDHGVHHNPWINSMETYFWQGIYLEHQIILARGWLVSDTAHYRFIFKC